MNTPEELNLGLWCHFSYKQKPEDRKKLQEKDDSWALLGKANKGLGYGAQRQQEISLYRALGPPPSHYVLISSCWLFKKMTENKDSLLCTAQGDKEATLYEELGKSLQIQTLWTLRLRVHANGKYKGGRGESRAEIGNARGQGRQTTQTSPTRSAWKCPRKETVGGVWKFQNNIFKKMTGHD